MPQRKPGESIEQYLIRTLFETGHLAWNPENPNGLNITEFDLPLLSIADQVVRDAIRSWTMLDVPAYTEAVLEAHDRTPHFDGEFGPAARAFLDVPRCPVPDFAPPPGVHHTFEDPHVQQVVERMQANAALPAQGRGGWYGCHDVGNFHCAVARWDLTRKPSHLPDETFLEVLRKVQRAYAAVGLLWRFTGPTGIDLLNGDNLSSLRVNTDATFVNSSSGWIGLAILGRNETCSSQIWARFLATYKGGNSEAAVVNQWWTLLSHEFMHNCGRSHTSGGVMNPSLMNGLPMDFSGDTSGAWLREQFGGVPVPLPGDPNPGPGPGPGPTPPPDNLSERVVKLERDVLIQGIEFRYRLERLEGKR